MHLTMSETGKKPTRNPQEIFDVEELLKIDDYGYAYYNEETNNLLFEPPVYIQRYQKVFDILINAKWRKYMETITEYGCGEFRLLKYFAHFLSLRQINFIDVNEVLLKEELGHLALCDYHYLNRRFNPLEVNVLHGCISNADVRILKSDVVIGVEIIEHLFPDTLEAIPFVIFHTIHPKIVIFTTPNADFNIAFPDFGKIRHPDHKFEWTRNQFESWSTNITLRFPDYKVGFIGVGKGPKGTESLGYCSQLAFFVRKDILDPDHTIPSFNCSCGAKYPDERNCEICNPMQPFGICTYLTKSKLFTSKKDDDLDYYRDIYSEQYQYRDDDDRSDEEKLVEIMMRNMSYLASNTEKYSLIALNRIISTYSYGVLISEEEAESILTKRGFKIEKHLVEDNFAGNIRKWRWCVEFVSPNRICENHPYHLKKLKTDRYHTKRRK